MAKEPEDIDEASTDDENKSSASSKKSMIPSSKIVQTIYNAIPKYYGEGDVQRLLDFTDKVEDYIDAVDMSSMLLVTMITTKLMGMASLMWRHHKKNNDQGSSSRIKSWKGLKELLFRTKITEEHEGSVLSQIDPIQ